MSDVFNQCCRHSLKLPISIIVKYVSSHSLNLVTIKIPIFHLRYRRYWLHIQDVFINGFAVCTLKMFHLNVYYNRKKMECEIVFCRINCCYNPFKIFINQIILKKQHFGFMVCIHWVVYGCLTMNKKWRENGRKDFFICNYCQWI